MEDCGHLFLTRLEAKTEPAEVACIDCLEELTDGAQRLIEANRALVDAKAEMGRRLAEVERERGEARAELEAYKRAKAENDDRFMGERDEARAEAGRLAGLVQRLKRYGVHLGNCGNWGDDLKECSCGLFQALAE